MLLKTIGVSSSKLLQFEFFPNSDLAALVSTPVGRFIYVFIFASVYADDTIRRYGLPDMEFSTEISGLPNKANIICSALWLNARFCQTTNHTRAPMPLNSNIQSFILIAIPVVSYAAYARIVLRDSRAFSATLGTFMHV